MHFDDVPLYGEFDVVVAGGGTAGFAAAAAAAKDGAKTLVVEEKACLGGTSTGGMISQFMGFASGETNETQTGVFGEVLRRLIRENASGGIETIYLTGLKEMDVGAASYDARVLKNVMDRMLSESGAKVLFHTKVIGLSMREKRLDYLVVHNIQGLQKVRARTFIDATFHGSVAVDAGCPWIAGDDRGTLQPGTLMYKMDGVNMAEYAKVPQDQRRALAAKGIEQGRMFVNNLLARSLPDGTVFSNMSRVSANPLDAGLLSEGEIAARKQVDDIGRFFREEVPGFADARIVATGDFMGLRDSRRILGQYVLKKEDIVEGTEFPDAVASSSYPIDIHDANGISSTLIKPKSGMFHVPFRCLVGDVENLVVAGRCISADCEAHACIRVMVTCFRTGEAAGIAAAESVSRNKNVNGLEGRLIREKLRHVR